MKSNAVTRIDDLFDEENRRHIWKHYWDLLRTRNILPSKAKLIINTIREVQNRIPKWVLKIIPNKQSWRTPFVVVWSDTDGEPIYGVANDDKLYELHVNDSGVGTIIYTPHDLTE
eukprot:6212815-Pleurochrysis_carterae.AAC.1